VPRRLVLAGTAGWLLTACRPPSGPSASTARSSSGSGTAPTGIALPTGVPTAGLPSPARPTPGVCGPQRSPRTSYPGKAAQPQHYLPCSGTTIALTLDDGPDPEWTPRMLSLLAHYRVRATFSVIGRQAAAHPGLVAEVAAAGHVVANHTYTHANLRTLIPAKVELEISRATDAIERAAGRRPTLFRAPGGEWSSEALAVCAREGLRPLDWSVDPRDWSRPGTQRIAEVILSQTGPGSIILEHDGGGDRRQTWEALSVVLPRLLDAGYVFGQP
jgi:peptidoglycan-N-acetylglucosamine deacetylase